MQKTEMKSWWEIFGDDFAPVLIFIALCGISVAIVILVWTLCGTVGAAFVGAFLVALMIPFVGATLNWWNLRKKVKREEKLQAFE